MEEELPGSIVPNLDVISHFHVAGSPNRDFPARHNEMDDPEILKALQTAGYEGHWGFEFYLQDTLEELKEDLALFSRYQNCPISG